MPRGSRTLTRALSVVLLSSAVLSACVPFGTDADAERLSAGPSAPTTTAPSATAPAAPMPSRTPSPSPTTYPPLGPLPDGVAPSRPAAMDGPPTLDAAKAVATYFLLLFSYVYQSNDLRAWQELRHAHCTFCSSVVSDVEARAAGGRHAQGGNVSVTRLRGTEVDVGHFFNVKATIREPAATTVESTGLVVEHTPAGVTEVDMVVLFEDGRWTVRAVDHKAVEG